MLSKLSIYSHKKASNELKKIYQNPSDYCIIHYSCESFYGKGSSPRIACIAILSMKNNQTKPFSLHKTAEEQNIDLGNDEKLDELEFLMLEELFAFIKIKSDAKWIHWGMDDGSYGFYAIEHRYKVLCKRLNRPSDNVYCISDNDKINLDSLLIQKYGAEYIEHPRMQKLLDLNKITPKDFLVGAQEAECFSSKDFYRMQLSTLGKVKAFKTILEKSVQESLCHNSNWKKNSRL